MSTQRLVGIEVVGVRTETVVSAGTTLAELQRYARGRGMEFGVDLASRESATLGGMIATNAGGIHVIRWGRMRAQVVGLEVVLADGQILDNLEGGPGRGICALEDLVVGSEGTLGVISRARLRLIPGQANKVVVLLSLDTLENAVLAAFALRTAIPDLTAVEYFGSRAVDLVRAHRNIAPPFRDEGGAFLLVEVSGQKDASEALSSVLEETPGILDTAVAFDPAGQGGLWTLRESITEAIGAVGIPQKYDVWLPPSVVPQFELSLSHITTKAGAELVLFGHLAEGSLHANVLGLEPGDGSIEDDVSRLVLDLGGNPRSEHGVGSTKVRWQHLAMSPLELRVLQGVKRAFDPMGLMSPGVLVPTD
jgi:FAD/FMN-containing dehydrogenase